MFSYRADGPFVILKTDGRSTAAERHAVYDTICSDPNVPDGAFLMIDIRKYELLITQPELQERVQALLEGLASKLATSCAILVGDVSLQVGLNLQQVAAKRKFLVGIFHNEQAARKWLAPGAH